MTVYADVVFFVNFAFDAGILLILSKLSPGRVSYLRVALSACLGGMQSLFAFVPYFRILCLPPAGACMAFVMAYIALGNGGFRAVLRGGTALLALTFALSGAVNFFGVNPLWGITLLIPIYFAVCMLKRGFTKRYKTAVLVYGEKKITAEGFCDSGNMAECNGKPVILADLTVFEKLFGKGFSVNAPQEWVKSEDLRIVPYTALGKSGVLYGIRLDKAVVDGKCYNDAVLGYFSDNFEDSLILNGIMT